MLAKVLSATVVGIDGRLITIEVDITKKGFGAFRIVGLASKSADEARDRIHTAIENSEIEFTKYKVTVNLAPADLPKEGPFYDVPIAVGILLAMGKIIPENVTAKMIFVGELSLDGSIKSTPAILPITLLAKEKGFREIYVPDLNANEASIVDGIIIYPVKSLQQLILHLNQITLINPIASNNYKINPDEILPDYVLEDVKGQPIAKRALIIAAAGGHNLLFIGPPGSGKTMLSRCLPNILPTLNIDESLEVTKIYSIIHQLEADVPLITRRPFRTPHHTTSRVGLIGGGSTLHPGEISLAHRGVLFLDEIPEFPRSVLESLRQPMEDGIVTITRAIGSLAYPASFMLVASSNPCPCGYFNSTVKQCTCSPKHVYAYQQRLSGPLLDRIDLQVFVKDTQPKEIIFQSNNKSDTEYFETIDARQQIQHARTIQNERFKETKISINANMNPRQISQFCKLSDELTEFLSSVATNFQLSARSIHKVLKVSRTIADLAGSEEIKKEHISEALNYRIKKED